MTQHRCNRTGLRGLMLPGLVVAAALPRLLPHPPNFTPVETVVRFGGARVLERRTAALDAALGARR